KIDNQHAEIGAPNTSLRPHDTKNFDRAGVLAAPPDSSGVDEQKPPALALIRNIDRISRCSGQFAHDRTLSLHDRIDQRRFTNVRPTHNRYRDWLRVEGSSFATLRRDK